LNFLNDFELSGEKDFLNLSEKKTGEQYRVSSWTSGLGTTQLVGNSWQPVKKTPDFLDRLAESLYQPLSPGAFRNWASSIPLRAYGIKVYFSAWDSLRLLSLFPEAQELLESNPALYFLFLFHCRFSKQSSETLRTRLRKKRRDLLKSFAIPSEEWLVKLLTKVECEDVGRHDIRFLKKICQKPVLFRQLNSLPSFPVSWSEMFLKQPGYFLSLFVKKEMKEFLSRPDGRRQFLQASQAGLLEYRDWVKTAKRIGIAFPEAELAKCVSREKVKEKMAQWQSVERLSMPWLVAPGKPPMDKVDFPEVRIGGNSWVKPISNNHQLWDEGQEMRHCVATYTAQVIRRECDIYHVESNHEQATLEIRWLRGLPHMGQLLSVSNKKPSEAFKKEVEDWFEEEKYEFLRVKKK